MKVALTYNLKKKDDAKPPDYYSEYDSPETIEAIIAALRKKGHSVEAIDIDTSNLLSVNGERRRTIEYANFFSYFRKNCVDIVFNIAEGKYTRFRESEVPALLDYLNIPYTGSNTFSLALALNKALTKKILKAENIPTPQFQVFPTGNEDLDSDLKFPLIVKPNCEGSAKGINKSNVVYRRDGLFKKIKETISVYKQEALVEEFIEGKELTVGIIENGKTTVLPILEIDFSNCKDSGEYFYSWRMKEYQGNVELGLVPKFHCPARLDREIEEKVKQAALKTHRAVGCFDISRIDIRLSKDNVPYVLEINPLPGLNPHESSFPLMAYAAGMQYHELIETILMSAYERRKGLN